MTIRHEILTLLVDTDAVVRPTVRRSGDDQKQ